jgi:hypothetical protein
VWANALRHVFDILWLNGQAVTGLPLEDRRALLERLPFEHPMHRVRLLDDERPWERASPVSDVVGWPKSSVCDAGVLPEP